MRLLVEVAYLSPIAGSLPFLSGQGVWLTVGGGRVRGWMLPSPGRATAPPADLTACAKSPRLAGRY